MKKIEYEHSFTFKIKGTKEQQKSLNKILKTRRILFCDGSEIVIELK
jgi:hypothetical protein